MKRGIYAKTDSNAVAWADLAGKLGVSRQTIYNWRKLPDAPISPDVDQWVNWAAANKPDSSHGDLNEVRRLVELEKLRKLKRNNEIEEGAIASVPEVAAFMQKTAATYDALLTQKIDVELPPLIVGQPIAEVRKICEHIHDEIREITNKGLQNWSSNKVSS